MKAWVWFGVAAALLWTPVAVAGSDDVSVVRGGRLYDAWFQELRIPPPSDRHPAFDERRQGGTVAAGDTWRCTQCHGWDYQGDGSGTVGIGRLRGADPASIVDILRNRTHGYQTVLSAGDLRDLAVFVSAGQVDMGGIVDRASGRAKGGAAKSEDHFGTICAGCHGRDGKQVRDVPPLGEASRDRPIEALHIILNGHAGGNMPPLRTLGLDLASNMLAFLQTLPGQNLPSSIARGGRLYDNWYEEVHTLPPSVPHPSYPVKAAYAEDAPRTWRCKECHGWDYLGAAGSYGAGSHRTGIKGIRALADGDPVRIVAILRDPAHRFGAVLKLRDLQDLSNFIRFGQVDMDAAIDRGTGRAKGDAARAKQHYEVICASCHGRDGRRMPTSPPLGQVAHDSPWEAMHKMVNGHPNEAMPALRLVDRSILVDILAYLQQLPQGK